MNTAKDIEELSECVATHYQECFPEDLVRLCFIDGTKYRKTRLSGPEVPIDEQELPLDQGLAGSVLKSGSPLWIASTHPTGKRNKLAPPITDTFPRSIMVLPLKAMGKAIGCIEMASNRPNCFDEIEYHLGLLVAAHYSSSLENVLAKQELSAANARLKDHDLLLTELNEKLRQQANTDELTGLFNKRRLIEQVEMEIARGRRYGEVLSCLMIDIDDFKAINDTYGHQAGDEVLRQTGALFRNTVRATDFSARYGGEEFTVLLPRTDSGGAHHVAENLGAAFRKQEFVFEKVRTHLTISIGFTTCMDFININSQRLIARADSALYRAKRAGKNRACFGDDSDEAYPEVRILSNM
jgi:diguanylate cyclase (GGDEF)-like protein